VTRFDPHSASYDDLLVLQPKLASEVDRDPGEHEVPRVARAAEHPIDPVVAALLEVRRIDGVVDVHVGVDVTPSDLDALLVHDGDRTALIRSGRQINPDGTQKDNRGIFAAVC
jgi:hypothetical protein